MAGSTGAMQAAVNGSAERRTSVAARENVGTSRPATARLSTRLRARSAGITAWHPVWVTPVPDDRIPGFWGCGTPARWDGLPSRPAPGLCP